ncbi:MAG TPA: inorganic phosphate transporter [Candidatus Limnocylindrales bacterium]|jgi:PiT family inorganic phosphate transporter|nr:inorganic phosphate transporter [Candidatus Limnocylindrales bacterium]
MLSEFTPLLIVLISLAVIFDFINGFHDTANAVATVISTRVLHPTIAIVMAAVLNFVGAMAGTEVAKTVGSGIVGEAVPLMAISAALLGAILWNLFTWYYGIPSSSSHALIGSLLGAGIASLGIHTVHWNVLWGKVVLPLFFSPVVGFIVALWLMRLLIRMFAAMPPGKVGPIFRHTQVVSAAFMAFSHGSNDAQKTMGIITLGLVSAGILPTFHVPTWVIAVSALAMAAGTLAGGRRIIHTMGTRLAHLEPIHGFAAETSAGAVIQVASHLGLPLSTTHVISSSILGVGAARRMTAVRWEVVKSMVSAWMLTIPVTAALGFAAASLAKALFPNAG